MAFVTCDKIGQGLTAWLGSATQLERDNLCAALACDAGGDVVAGLGINITGTGDVSDPFVVNVKQDANPDNAATLTANGLNVLNAKLDVVGDNLVFVDNKGMTHQVLDLSLLAQPTATASPVLNTGVELPTSVYGARTALLGQPAGWIEFPAGTGQKIPYWS